MIFTTFGICEEQNNFYSDTEMLRINEDENFFLTSIEDFYELCESGYIAQKIIVDSGAYLHWV